MEGARRKVIYVSGPYRAKTEAQVFQNIMRARDAAIKLWDKGWVALCPHLNTMLFGGVVSEDEFIAGDLELVTRCDAIFMLEGWPHSEGANMERTAAQMTGKQIFYEGDGFPEVR